MFRVLNCIVALSAIRPYKPPLVPRRVYEIMVSDKGAFDPIAFGVFVRSVGLYPPGCKILLSDGSRGVVTAAGVDPEKPCVLLTADHEGNEIPESDQDVLDLGIEDEATLEVVDIAGI